MTIPAGGGTPVSLTDKWQYEPQGVRLAARPGRS